MKTEPEAEGVQVPPKVELGLCVGPSNAGHSLGAFLWSERICHGLLGTQDPTGPVEEIPTV